MLKFAAFGLFIEKIMPQTMGLRAAGPTLLHARQNLAF